MIKKLMAQKLN